MECPAIKRRHALYTELLIPPLNKLWQWLAKDKLKVNRRSIVNEQL